MLKYAACNLLELKAIHDLFHFHRSRAFYLEIIQKDIPLTDWDYDFVNYYRKAYEFGKFGAFKEENWQEWKHAEAIKQFYLGSITEIKHLKQFDETPNLELQEPKWELYKISISFPFVGNVLN